MILLLLAATWESPRVPPGEGSTAAECGACHQEIYAEWKASVHAHAWTDVQFQQELAKDPEVGWLCLNCHTPASDQQAELALHTGKVREPQRSPSPAFSAAFRDEGLSCVGCHWRPEGIAGPFGDTEAPHAVVKAPELLDNTACTSCHQAVSTYEEALVCHFNTGEEWSESGSSSTCQSCHMPEVTRALVPGGVERPGRRHLFLGSGIPKDSLPPEEVAFYSLFPPAVDVEFVGDEVVLTNSRADHLVPTGDPERYLLVKVEALDAKGQVLATTTYRIGQVWEWWPAAKQIADNRLQPGETRRIPVEVPRRTKELHVLVEHYRISPDNAEYHGLEGYPTKRLVHEERRRID
ncbi:MAG TPA: multiheme c-type cytochrome [Myxococcota bacterium]|nr:multiheme c-type cytochrome [Myxococcota bacterium]